MVTGTVVYDLTAANPEHMRSALSSLHEVPDDARIVVRVGAMLPDPPSVRVLAEHHHRLLIDVHGTPFAVRWWVAEIRSGSGVPR